MELVNLRDFPRVLRTSDPEIIGLAPLLEFRSSWGLYNNEHPWLSLYMRYSVFWVPQEGELSLSQTKLAIQPDWTGSTRSLVGICRKMRSLMLCRTDLPSLKSLGRDITIPVPPPPDRPLRLLSLGRLTLSEQ